MKLRELLEDLQMPQQSQKTKEVLRTDSYNEYQNALDKLASDRDNYRFEEITPPGSDEFFDIIVNVQDYSYSEEVQDTMGRPGGDEEHSISWDVDYYGTGDFDNDKNFYIMQSLKRDGFPLDNKTQQYIEDTLIEDQFDKYEPVSYDDYHADDERDYD